MGHCRTGSSATISRIQAEQHAIEARLADLEGLDAIREMLQDTKIEDEDRMSVDRPPTSPLASAKQRALAKYVRYSPRVLPTSVLIDKPYSLILIPLGGTNRHRK